MDGQRLVIKIANIVLEFPSGALMGGIPFGDEFKGFLCEDKPDVTVSTHPNGLAELRLRAKDKVFDSGVRWSLYQPDGRNVFTLRMPSLGPLPYRVAIFDSKFRKGDIYSRDLSPHVPPDSFLLDPLAYPLSDLLMICLLSQGRGLMVHACGILDNGKGYLFAGNSTHGKTTMARIWKDHAIVLNDDRIVLRQRDGQFWMYGTPWHGEYNGVSPEGVPVEKVFFLRHAESNTVERKNESDAATMLLTRSFPPLWDADGMRFTLDFCAEFVNAVPCYELGFVPSEEIIELVRSVE